MRFHFRVRVQTSFRWQMEEPGGTRPEHIDLHITGALKEGCGGVHRAYGKDGGGPDPNGWTWRETVEQRGLESSGTLMEQLGEDQSLKERSEGVKEGKKCGLESSRAQTEGSGGDPISQLVLVAWLNSDFHCTGQNSHNISHS